MAVDFDLASLEPWLVGQIPGFSGILSAEKFTGGQSNPTYRLVTDRGSYVLRRKPFGDLLPSAHAVDREFRLLSKLHPYGFPAPRPIALCDDANVIGAMFYLMEMVEGRTFWPGTMPDQEPTERRAIYEAMILTLAHLHSIDHEAAGLGDFGRRGNYFARQVDRWTKQYRASQTDDIEEVERLIEWFPRTIPEQTRTSIIHGDYRIDNLIFAGGSPTVAAVIDWELATIGDPLADFTYLMMNWVMPVDDRSGLAGSNFAACGIPSMDEAMALYCDATGRDGVPDLHWYFAFNLFRLTAILQGVKRRMLDGNASSANASELVARLILHARAAWEQAEMAGAS